jgi:hypothetical protein
MTYMNCEDSELLKVISKEELDWTSSIRIPYTSTGGEWAKKHGIDTQITKALQDGVITAIEYEEVMPTRGVQIIGDYINGAGGSIKNMADGKIYDSKSAYYKAVKASGCEVLGSDAPREAKPIEYKVCERDLAQDISNAYKQLGG